MNPDAVDTFCGGYVEICSATSRVYVVTDTSPGAITIIDEKALAVSGTIPVGNDPRGQQRR